MSPRPDLIPGGTARGTAVPCTCLSWRLHVPIPLSGGGMSGMPRLPLLQDLAACFHWNRWMLYTLQQRLNRWKMVHGRSFDVEIPFTASILLHWHSQMLFHGSKYPKVCTGSNFFQWKGFLSLILPWVGFDYVWKMAIRQLQTVGGNFEEIKELTACSLCQKDLVLL